MFLYPFVSTGDSVGELLAIGSAMQSFSNNSAKDAGDFAFVCCINSCSKRSANEKNLPLAAHSNPMKKILKRSRKNPPV
jgi:hypothetical protein